MTEGDVALLQALHDEHGSALWSFCLRLTGNDHARAEDLVQETLLRAWRHPEAMATLSPDHRAVLLECYYRGRPVADAATRLGVPEGTVKSRLFLARKQLKERLSWMVTDIRN